MNRDWLLKNFKAIFIPLVYVFFLRVLFDIATLEQLYSVMSVSFLCISPLVVGALTVYFSEEKYARIKWYRFFIPWLPILLFLLVTITTKIEGWACWLMILPLFLLTASLGGFIGAFIKFKRKKDKFYVTAFCFLPLFLSPIENFVGAIPGTYQAYTYIDIKSTQEKIWSNVTRVREIKEEQDKGWLTKSLGFPRPVKAELNFEGVGAYREAKFTNGLVFHETVSDYIDKKKMVFSIKAYPHEIPSTTMDEHIVIGGQYFDVLNGTYELEKLNDKIYRLHLYSHFKLTTTFNFYASWWAKWIMKDIQNNILQVVQYRAENE